MLLTLCTSGPCVTWITLTLSCDTLYDTFPMVTSYSWTWIWNCYKFYWKGVQNLSIIYRAVASLTVPGGQEFHFPPFFLKFWSIFLIFPQTLLIFFLILALRVGDSPTREGPGYATDYILSLAFRGFPTSTGSLFTESVNSSQGNSATQDSSGTCYIKLQWYLPEWWEAEAFVHSGMAF